MTNWCKSVLPICAWAILMWSTILTAHPASAAALRQDKVKCGEGELALPRAPGSINYKCVARTAWGSTAGPYGCSTSELPVPDERAAAEGLVGYLCMGLREWKRAEKICSKDLEPGEIPDPMGCLCQDGGIAGACGVWRAVPARTPVYSRHAEAAPRKAFWQVVDGQLTQQFWVK